MKELDLKEIEEKLNEAEFVNQEPVKKALKKRLKNMRKKLDAEIAARTGGQNAV